jgi:hypothetical protein
MTTDLFQASGSLSTDHLLLMSILDQGIQGVCDFCLIPRAVIKERLGTQANVAGKEKFWRTAEKLRISGLTWPYLLSRTPRQLSQRGTL